MTDVREIPAAPAGAILAAEADAARSAGTAGVTIELVHGLDELRAVDELFRSIWTRADGQAPMASELLRALAHSGNYVASAHDADGIVAATVGFLGSPGEQVLHSHIAGVLPRARGRGVGHALKLHQRAWAAARGISAITWTFDPLVSRNAYFNIAKLGALPREYLVDFYGEMSDGINAGQGSDRLLVSWPTTPRDAVRLPDLSPAPALVAEDDDVPRRRTASGPLLSVAVPRDIESLRSSRPALAQAWRSAVRDTLGGLMAEGATVVGFDRNGAYLLLRT